MTAGARGVEKESECVHLRTGVRRVTHFWTGKNVHVNINNYWHSGCGGKGRMGATVRE